MDCGSSGSLKQEEAVTVSILATLETGVEGVTVSILATLETGVEVGKEETIDPLSVTELGV